MRVDNLRRVFMMSLVLHGLVLFLTILVLAQRLSALPQLSPASDAQRCSISGRVLHANTGEPLKRVRVVSHFGRRLNNDRVDRRQ
jgi:hypothetical protein